MRSGDRLKMWELAHGFELGVAADDVDDSILLEFFDQFCRRDVQMTSKWTALHRNKRN